MATYTIDIDSTGAESARNVSRAEHGQPSETLTIDGSLVDAIAAVGFARRADIRDEYGDLVARVTYDGAYRARAYDADGGEIYL